MNGFTLLQLFLAGAACLIVGLVAGGIMGYSIGFDIGWRARPEDEKALEELSSQEDPTIPLEMKNHLAKKH